MKRFWLGEPCSPAGFVPSRGERGQHAKREGREHAPPPRGSRPYAPGRHALCRFRAARQGQAARAQQHVTPASSSTSVEARRVRVCRVRSVDKLIQWRHVESVSVESVQCMNLFSGGVSSPCMLRQDTLYRLYRLSRPVESVHPVSMSRTCYDAATAFDPGFQQLLLPLRLYCLVLAPARICNPDFQHVWCLPPNMW